MIAIMMPFILIVSIAVDKKRFLEPAFKKRWGGAVKDVNLDTRW